MSDDLARIAERATQTGQLALDTEFMSEGRYYPLLCLVQVAVDGRDEQPLIGTIDTLAGQGPGPLLPLLTDPKVEVVVHAGRQDLFLIERAWDVRPSNVFDTQIAAALTTTTQQSSYQLLVSQVLGISLKKGESFTHWDQRPLTAEQLKYAAQDVEHLLHVAAVLHDRLRSAGRVEWAREECRLLEATSGEERDPEEVFLRLTATTRLTPAEAAIARELAHWRESTAREQDRPVRSVLPDRLVTQLARRSPKSVEALRKQRGVGEGISRRYGNQLLAAVRRGEQAPPVHLPRRPEQPSWFGPLTALCDALVRARCEEQQIATEMVATRAEVGEIVLETVQGRPEPQNRLLTGWRRDIVGEEVLDLLRGERALRVGENGHLVVDRLG
ncbi:MAG TPA: ribonuclease D [Solirubrobacterales bacterium]|nr:ribonuclease D [Solirubrobacterales bacterium]